VAVRLRTARAAAFSTLVPATQHASRSRVSPHWGGVLRPAAARRAPARPARSLPPL